MRIIEKKMAAAVAAGVEEKGCKYSYLFFM